MTAASTRSPRPARVDDAHRAHPRATGSPSCARALVPSPRRPRRPRLHGCCSSAWRLVGLPHRVLRLGVDPRRPSAACCSAWLVAHVVTAFRLPAVVTPARCRRGLLPASAGRSPSASTSSPGSSPRARPSATSPHTAVHGWKRLLTLLPPVDAMGPLLALPLIVGLVGASGHLPRRAPQPGRVCRGAGPARAARPDHRARHARAGVPLAQGAAFGLLAIGWMIVRSTRTRAPLQNGAGRGRAAGIGAGLLVAGRRRRPASSGPHLPGADGDAAPGGAHRGGAALRRRRSSPARWPASASTPSPTTRACSTRELLRRHGRPGGHPAAVRHPRRLRRRRVGRRPTGPAPDAPSPVPRSSRSASGWPPRGEGTPADAAGHHPRGRLLRRVAADRRQVDRGEVRRPREPTSSPRGCGSTPTRARRSCPTGSRPVTRYTHGRACSRPRSPARAARRRCSPTSGNLDREPGARLPRRQGRRLDPRRRATRGPSCRAVARAMRDDGAYTDGGSQELGQESYYLAGHSRGRLARFVGATQLAGNDEQYAATLALVGQPLRHPDPGRHGCRAARGRRRQGPRRPRLGRGAGQHRHLGPVLPKTSCPTATRSPTSCSPRPTSRRSARSCRRRPGSTRRACSRARTRRRTPSTSRSRRRSCSTPRPGRGGCGSWSSTSCCPLLALVALYWAIRGAKAWRRRRHATRGTATARVAWAWDDLMNSARSFGHALPRRATRLEQAAPLDRLPSANALAAQANAHDLRPRHPRGAGRRGLLEVDQRGARRPARQLRLLAATALRRRPAPAVRPRAGDPRSRARRTPPARSPPLTRKDCCLVKLKFTLRASGDVDTDLVATVDGTTTVGQLAEYLVLADPARAGQPRTGQGLGDFTLSHVGRGLPRRRPAATIAESGLRSGAHVAVTRRTEGYADRGQAVRHRRRRGRPGHRPGGPARCRHGIPRSRSGLRDPAERRAGLAPPRAAAGHRHRRGHRPRLLQRHPGAGPAGRPGRPQERRPVPDRRDRDRGADRRWRHRPGAPRAARRCRSRARRGSHRSTSGREFPVPAAAGAAQARAAAVDRRGRCRC